MKVLSSLKVQKIVLAAKLFAATVSSMSFRKPTLALKLAKVEKERLKEIKKSGQISALFSFRH